MGLPPKGKVVARPMVVRACGHEQEFQHYAVDKFRAERLAKFQQTRCPACVAKLAEEQRMALPPRKGEALRQLPPGTQVTLSRAADGSWSGTLSAEGTSVQMTGAGGESGPGPQAVTVALARLWIEAREKKPESA
jgi:hypothetical protein